MTFYLKMHPQSKAKNHNKILLHSLPVASNSENEKIIPQWTTLNVLLCLLWFKAEGRGDLPTFFEAIAKKLGVKPDELCIMPQVHTTFSTQDIPALKAKSEQEIQKLSLSDLIYARYFDESDWPPYIHFSANAICKGSAPFSDCGETALRNFLNIIAYNPKTQTFNADIIKQLGGTETRSFLCNIQLSGPHTYCTSSQ